jgi:hypothetical protein
MHALEDVSLFRISTIRALCMLGTADAVDALNVNSHTQKQRDLSIRMGWILARLCSDINHNHITPPTVFDACA